MIWDLKIRWRPALCAACKILFVCSLLILCTAMASGPLSKQFRFSDVEDHVTFLSDQQAQDKAQQYLDEHFPAGSSIQQVMATLTKAGANCSYRIDPNNPEFYFCDYTEPGGIFDPFIQIDWLIRIYYSKNMKSIKSIAVVRGATGF